MEWHRAPEIQEGFDMKLKTPKPIRVKFQWQKELGLSWMIFIAILLSFAVAMFISDKSYENKILEQDLKIQRQDHDLAEMYDLIIKLVIYKNDADRQIEILAAGLKRLNAGHRKQKTQHGLIYTQHEPLREGL